MNRGIFRLVFDIQRKGSQHWIRVTQNDTARVIEAQLTDGGNTYVIEKDCTATFRANNGTELDLACNIVDGKIVFAIPTNVTGTVGTLDAEFALYGAGKKLITAPAFQITVVEAIGNDTPVEADDNFSALTAALSQVATAVQSANTAAGAANTAANSANVAASTAATAANSANTAAGTATTASIQANVAANAANGIAADLKEDYYNEWTSATSLVSGLTIKYKRFGALVAIELSAPSGYFDLTTPTKLCVLPEMCKPLNGTLLTAHTYYGVPVGFTIEADGSLYWTKNGNFEQEFESPDLGQSIQLLYAAKDLAL